MGIWDGFRSTAVTLIPRKSPEKYPGESTRRSPYTDGVTTTVTKFRDSIKPNGAQKLKEHDLSPVSREKIKGILTSFRLFAVDSSIKAIFSGEQEYKTVKEGLEDHSPSQLSKEKRDLTLVIEEMQVKMEKMQDNMNNMKQRSKTSTWCAEGFEPLKELLNEPTEGSAPSKTDAKRVFIRSRQ